MPQNETSGYLVATNPVLASGVSLTETDSGLLKTGDGVTAWNSLRYPTQTATLAVWGGFNPILARGARGTATGLTAEFDSAVTVGVRVGDGVTPWNQLPWVENLSSSFGRLSTAARQLVPIADRIRPTFNSAGNYPALTLSNGTSLGGTAREAVVAQFTGHGLVVDFSNWYNNSGETAGPNAITITASIELTSTYNMPITFNGALSVTIGAGVAQVRSDPIGVRVTKGQTFWIRTYVSGITSTQKYPLLRQSRGNTYGEGLNVDPAVAGPGADISGYGQGWAAGTNGAQNLRVPGPAMLCGTPEVMTASALFLTDSIGSGTGENYCFGASVGQSQFLDFGWVSRACYLKWPHLMVGMSGTDLSSWTINTGAGAFRRKSYMESSYFTHIICALGINDLNASRTLVQTQALWVTTWTDLATHGRPVYQTTLGPYTSSTDNWTTVASQTASLPGSGETYRTQGNDWIRDGAPILAGVAVATGSNAAGTLRAGMTGHPLTGCIELADSVESARNSGKWKALPGARIVTDGAITATLTTLTSATANFTAADVGRRVIINGAGSSGGTHTVNITVITNPTTVTVNFAAVTTVSGASTYIGTNGTTMDGIHPSGTAGGDPGGHELLATAAAAALTPILGALAS
jgi:hypothetical protein